MPWGSCPCPGVEMRGSPPLAPPLCVCGEIYLTLPYDACRVPAQLGARDATAPAREGAGAAAAGGRTARQPAQQRPAQRPPAQQPEQPVRALRGEYCRPAALRRPGGSTRSNFASRARAEAPAARARPAASRRRRNMAYSTALEEEEEAGWQCCMPPRGSFGVLSPSQGAAEGVRNRDNPPPQPRPVEAPLGAAMRSPLGAEPWCLGVEAWCRGCRAAVEG